MGNVLKSRGIRCLFEVQGTFLSPTRDEGLRFRGEGTTNGYWGIGWL